MLNNISVPTARSTSAFIPAIPSPVEPDEDGVIELECFLDVSSLEVFVNGGRHTMTGLVYPKETSLGISFYSEGGKSTLLEYQKSDILP